MRPAVLYFALASCAASSGTEVAIRLEHGSADERATADQLRRWVERHDLTPWQHTRTVIIDETSVPHSHPVLTLHARHLRDDLLLLSTYIHEQSHWYLEENAAATSSAVGDLEAMFPDLPVGFPEGAHDRRSSYEHLIVNTLEHAGLAAVVGELAAQQALQFWATDHYRALYRIVLERRRDIVRVLREHRLMSAE